ncbi:uncharacterized protein LOC135488109 [Lineus longissimus]|uniref:uncharacterized protein LOC135488109 n=1 Tax=Lineus longissimus TaxID=88925 RepID=UPI00315D298E
MSLFTMFIDASNQDRGPLDNTQESHDRYLIQHAERIRKCDAHLPISERYAILNLDQSWQKKTLGKYQSTLTDVAKHCREQEINELSGRLTRQCTVQSFEKTKGTESHNQGHGDARPDLRRRQTTYDQPSSPSVYSEWTMSNFPTRRIQTRHGMDQQTPSPQITYRKGVHPYRMQTKANFLRTQKINGPIQLDHYINGKSEHFAPLVLPQIPKERNKMDDFISSSKVQLQTRDGKTNTNIPHVLSKQRIFPRTSTGNKLSGYGGTVAPGNPPHPQKSGQRLHTTPV